jgi:tetratricopeptide (TPR) repeat protein
MLAAEPRNPKFHRQQALSYLYRSAVYSDELLPNLDNPARALESAKRYLDAAEAMARRDPANVSAQFSRAVAKSWLSVPLRESDPQAAFALARDSVREFDELIASGTTGYLYVSRRARALRRLGEAELTAGRVTDARRSAEASLSAERQVARENPAEAAEQRSLIQVLILAGRTSAATRDPQRAENLLREAREEAQRIVKPQGLASIIPLARSEQALGAFYAHQGRTEEARACYQRLAGLWQRFPEPNEYVNRQKAGSARLLTSLEE